jgi:hypothetical protein
MLKMIGGRQLGYWRKEKTSAVFEDELAGNHMRDIDAK